MAGWPDDARALFDEVYDLDWVAHIRALNTRLGLTGRGKLLEVATTPEFFFGDLDAFRPHEWVAVVSLNPKMMSVEDLAWQASQTWTADSLWQYLTRRDLRGFVERDFYYTKFARPLVILAGAALGIPDPVPDEVSILMRRMGLFETLPYPSDSYVPDAAHALELSRADVGCRVSLGIAMTAISRCPPAAVLVNGNDAVRVFEALAGPGFSWDERRYQSDSKAGKSLRHSEAHISSEDGPVPVFGLPHLRTQSGHNSNVEVAQLARRVAEVVRGA